MADAMLPIDRKTWDKGDDISLPNAQVPDSLWIYEDCVAWERKGEKKWPRCCDIVVRGRRFSQADVVAIRRQIISVLRNVLESRGKLEFVWP